MYCVCVVMEYWKTQGFLMVLIIADGGRGEVEYN
jgi:hypothetical protein